MCTDLDENWHARPARRYANQNGHCKMAAKQRELGLPYGEPRTKVWHRQTKFGRQINGMKTHKKYEVSFSSFLDDAAVPAAFKCQWRCSAPCGQIGSKSNTQVLCPILQRRTKFGANRGFHSIYLGDAMYHRHVVF